MSTGHDNPFYQNYVFSKDDFHRGTIEWWQYPLLLFKTMYCQITADGYIVKYKLDGCGRIYIFDMKEFDCVTKHRI